MNDIDDIDDQYRHASAQDPSQPSESTRRSILARAAELAAQRTGGNGQVSPDFRRPAANQPSWRLALVGTLAAAGLAGLLMTPLFLPPQAPTSTKSRATVAGKAASENAAESERATSAAPPAPNAFPAPAAKRVLTTPAAPRNTVPQEAFSARQESAAPPASAGAPIESPAPASRSTVAQERLSSGGAGLSNALVQGSAAPRWGGAVFGSGLSPGAALQQAADAGDISRLQALLATPIDVNVRDAHGRTALMLATMRGQASAVDILLAHGADANAADADGVTPLQAAVAAAQPGIAAALQRAGAR
jgi:hypothetical protein